MLETCHTDQGEAGPSTAGSALRPDELLGFGRAELLGRSIEQERGKLHRFDVDTSVLAHEQDHNDPLASSPMISRCRLRFFRHFTINIEREARGRAILRTEVVSSPARS